MNEQPLDLRRSLDALRRRRVAIAIVGLLGLCLGLLNVAAHRTPPTAVAVVLIPGQAGQNGNMAPIIQGQAYVATTPALRDPVIKSLTPPVRPGQVGVKVTASDSVLSIRRSRAAGSTGDRPGERRRRQLHRMGQDAPAPWCWVGSP